MPSDAAGLEGKHAIVTGGASGIGLAIASLLSECGARVSVVSRSALSASGDDGDRFFRAAADVTVAAEVAAAFASCRQVHGPIAILVNNAGIAESAPLRRTTLSMWERILATNLTGTFLCTREASEDMMAARWGRILSVASIAGLSGAAYVSAYCASKHGVVGFTRAVAAEFEGSGVTANVLCPGYTETEMVRAAVANISRLTGAGEAAGRARLASSNPQGRIASVDEVAAAALDLLAGTRNGMAVVVPGGATA